MSYKALYRKWRPDEFEELIGQEHVTTTLKNAILYNRISHAYLFCGPRGTGKTSAAKLLAKGLNCIEGPTDTPCGKCENCRAMEENRFFDVIEIDAASNRGIDEIRDIRDQVVYPPSQGSYKVYIIDEVHMLTQEAFNALLKTLEEPPGYILFVLATTEPHKLPMTILSRCQRFDFHRLSVKDIVNRLKKIMENDKIAYEEKAIFTIARYAEGGMRDALSLLDQCLSYSTEDKLFNEEVLKIIGSVNEDILYRLVKSVINSDINTALLIVKEINEQGKDITQFFKDLMSYYRDILLVKTGTHDEDLLKGEYEKLKELGSYFENHELIASLDFISEKHKELKWSQNQRLILEITLFRLINRDKIFSELKDQVKFLEGRINKLEQKLESGNWQGKDLKSKPPKETKPSNEFSVSKEKEEKEEKEEKAQRKEVKDKVDETLDISEVKSAWQDILEDLKKEKIYAYAYAVEGTPIEIKGNTLYIGFSPQHSIHKERAEKKENREAIEKVIEKRFSGIKVAFKLIEDESKKKSK